MRVRTIRKPDGRMRTIYVPSPKEKAILRVWLPGLVRVAQELDAERQVMHGFMPGRSPVTNAARHVGYQYTVSFDLADFFDHVNRFSLVPFGLAPSQKELELMFPGGYARQGLPTSPALANIAGAMLFDGAVMSAASDAVYTRYADDLTFSTNSPDTVSRLLETVPGIVELVGFPINPRKTKVQSAKAGRRIVTGVAVGDTDIGNSARRIISWPVLFPTRKAKRRLRAALHQSNCNQARGLAEWCKLKRPKRAIATVAAVVAPQVTDVAQQTLPPVLPQGRRILI